MKKRENECGEENLRNRYLGGKVITCFKTERVKSISLKENLEMIQDLFVCLCYRVCRLYVFVRFSSSETTYRFLNAPLPYLLPSPEISLTILRF
jgi:hypothetical protein